MSDFFKILVLAVVQGLTEFLPVSSSGHLVLAEHFLKLEAPGVTLELFLHIGTLAAVVFFYRKKLLALLLGIFTGERASWIFALWTLLSMVPAGVCYVVGGDEIESKYENPSFVAFALIATGVVLMLTAFARKPGKRGGGGFRWYHALGMGVAQAVAMLPGVSRSGSTIAAARFMGVKPAEAAEFSFIMSIPVIGGAALVDIVKNSGGISASQGLQYAAGAALAGVVGLAAIKWFVSVLGKGKLWTFGIYCAAVGALALLFI